MKNRDMNATAVARAEMHQDHKNAHFFSKKRRSQSSTILILDTNQPKEAVFVL